jgi:hypothetical protein
VVEVIGLLSGSPIRAGRTSFPITDIPYIRYFNKQTWQDMLFEQVPPKAVRVFEADLPREGMA